MRVGFPAVKAPPRFGMAVHVITHGVGRNEHQEVVVTSDSWSGHPTEADRQLAVRSHHERHSGKVVGHFVYLPATGLLNRLKRTAARIFRPTALWGRRGVSTTEILGVRPRPQRRFVASHPQ